MSERPPERSIEWLDTRVEPTGGSNAGGDSKPTEPSQGVLNTVANEGQEAFFDTFEREDFWRLQAVLDRFSEFWKEQIAPSLPAYAQELHLSEEVGEAVTQSDAEQAGFELEIPKFATYIDFALDRVVEVFGKYILPTGEILAEKDKLQSASSEPGGTSGEKTTAEEQTPQLEALESDGDSDASGLSKADQFAGKVGRFFGKEDLKFYDGGFQVFNLKDAQKRQEAFKMWKKAANEDLRLGKVSAGHVLQYGGVVLGLGAAPVVGAVYWVGKSAWKMAEKSTEVQTNFNKDSEMAKYTLAGTGIGLGSFVVIEGTSLVISMATKGILPEGALSSFLLMGTKSLTSSQIRRFVAHRSAALIAEKLAEPTYQEIESSRQEMALASFNAGMALALSATMFTKGAWFRTRAALVDRIDAQYHDYQEDEEGVVGDQAVSTPTKTPTPSPTLTKTSTPIPSSPTPTMDAVQYETPEPTPTQTPIPPTPTPAETSTPEPTVEPTATPTQEATPQPTPTEQEPSWQPGTIPSDQELDNMEPILEQDIDSQDTDYGGDSTPEQFYDFDHDDKTDLVRDAWGGNYIRVNNDPDNPLFALDANGDGVIDDSENNALYTPQDLGIPDKVASTGRPPGHASPPLNRQSGPPRPSQYDVDNDGDVDVYLDKSTGDWFLDTDGDGAFDVEVVYNKAENRVFSLDGNDEYRVSVASGEWEPVPVSGPNALSDQERTVTSNNETLVFDPEGGVIGLIQQRFYEDHPNWTADQIAKAATTHYYEDILPNLPDNVPMYNGDPVVYAGEDIDSFLGRIGLG